MNNHLILSIPINLLQHTMQQF